MHYQLSYSNNKRSTTKSVCFSQFPDMHQLCNLLVFLKVDFLTQCSSVYRISHFNLTVSQGDRRPSENSQHTESVQHRCTVRCWPSCKIVRATAPCSQLYKWAVCSHGNPTDRHLHHWSLLCSYLALGEPEISLGEVENKTAGVYNKKIHNALRTALDCSSVMARG